MNRPLPPLNSLKAFEAAARRLSFTTAAQELGVTQGAISKQVQILEQFLSFSLFDRSSRQLTLSTVGKVYYAGIKEAFALIKAVTESVQVTSRYDNALIISAMPSLSYWLIPRIEGFKNQHPDLTIEIVSDDNPIKSLEMLEAEIGLVRANKKPKAMEAELFTREEVVLVCRPQLILNADDISQVEDIGRYTLLEHTSRPVRSDAWFSKEGLDKIAFYDTLRFRHFFMIAQAVKEGLGVAFLPRFLVESDIKSGILVNILNAQYVTGYSYYVIHTKNKGFSPKVQAFTRWIKDQGL